MYNIRFARSSKTGVIQNPDLIDTAHWALTLLRFNLAKYGLTANQIVSSDWHQPLIGIDRSLTLLASARLDLADSPGDLFGTNSLADVMTATVTVDIRARMMFGASLDMAFQIETIETGLALHRGELGERLVDAMRMQEDQLLDELVRANQLARFANVGHELEV